MGSFHYFKPVSCWILFGENVAGVPRPFDQLPSRVGKINTYTIPEMRLFSTQTFEVDVSQLFLLDIFVILSFLPRLTVSETKVAGQTLASSRLLKWPATGPY